MSDPDAEHLPGQDVIDVRFDIRQPIGEFGWREDFVVEMTVTDMPFTSILAMFNLPDSPTR